jgi:hypothetical protein
MRTALTSLVLGAVFGSGCTGQCSAAALFSGRTYDIFANPVSYTLDNPSLTDSPNFYSYTVPSNGTSAWTFQWGATANGPVDVGIDGQSFAGNGEWDEVECGHALLDFEGTYVDEATETRHTFKAKANLTIWQDKLGGLLVWNESFEMPDGETGTWTGSSHLDGVLISGI